MSLFDRFRDEDGETTEESAATDGGDPFDADLEDEKDAFTDDAFGDEMLFDEGSEEYANEEFENRVDEIETELASLSSTVNTIRSENEEISTTVENVEENVRKLLDVYEMVTRGINPFTDDIDAAGGQSGSLGLFDTDGSDEAADDLDEDVVSADADSFFDDDIDEDDGNGETPDVEEPDANEAATSFDDLKAEYEAGEADWDDESADENEDETPEPTDESTESSGETTLVAADGADLDPDLQFAEQTLSDAPSAEKPYLRGLPDGYVADLLVLEWLEYLVDAADQSEAERAIDYYEAVNWIDETATEGLRAFIDGFDATTDEDADRLTISHHTQSLRYICQLSSSTSAPVVLEGWNDGTRRFGR